MKLLALGEVVSIPTWTWVYLILTSTTGWIQRGIRTSTGPRLLTATITWQDSNQHPDQQGARLDSDFVPLFCVPLHLLQSFYYIVTPIWNLSQGNSMEILLLVYFQSSTVVLDLNLSHTISPNILLKLFWPLLFPFPHSNLNPILYSWTRDGGWQSSLGTIPRLWRCRAGTLCICGLLPLKSHTALQGWMV